MWPERPRVYCGQRDAPADPLEAAFDTGYGQWGISYSARILVGGCLQIGCLTPTRRFHVPMCRSSPILETVPCGPTFRMGRDEGQLEPAKMKARCSQAIWPRGGKESQQTSFECRFPGV
jgi:hypothetical protein